jgi:hypothetical protein
MSSLGYALLWVGCVIAGGIVGFLVGYLLWQLGFELIGSAVALVGGVAGAVIAFILVLGWSQRRQSSHGTKS